MKRYKSIFRFKDSEKHTGKCDRFSYMLESVIDVDGYTQLISNLINRSIILFSKSNDKSIDALLNTFNNIFESLRIYFIKSENNLNKKYGIDKAETEGDKFNSIYVHINSFFPELLQNEEKEIKKYLLNIIKHEILHRLQAIRMKSEEIINEVFNRDANNAEEYYSDPQEIMAYAWMILEFSRMKPQDDLKTLEQLKSGKLKEDHYLLYRNMFGKDSKEFHLLNKYIYEYLTKKL